MTQSAEEQGSHELADNRTLLLATIPAIFGIAIYELFLGHRHDYSGHYAAGYGATFAAAMFLFRLVGPSEMQRRGPQLAFPFCLVCIAGGALAEATIFRIAKFDEIDFFNQSLGAVLATICASTYLVPEKHTELDYNCGLIVGIAFLGVGGCLAVS